MGIIDTLKHGWNAFTSRQPTSKWDYGPSYTYRPDRPRYNYGNEKTAMNAILTRIAIDCAMVKIQHVKLDKDGRFEEEVDDGLNYCLNVSANTDQSGFALKRDMVASLLDEGCIAIVPTKGKTDPTLTNFFNIEEIRIGKVVEWYPQHIRVELFDADNSRKKEIVVLKRLAAIIENPFYQLMNERNSTAQRLNRKLAMLDALDEQNSSGKLDLIIQLPYVIKNDTKREQAERRRKDIEMQLSSSKYGIAYTDGTERITQLNRAVENNLLSQIEYLTNMLHNQLGMPQGVFDGTADEKTMLNYNNRTIAPIITAIVAEMNRKFLTQTARSQGHAVIFMSEPFKLVPINQLADIADKFTRNEIMSSNELRQIVGLRPSKDPEADELRNKNLNKSKEELQEPAMPPEGMPYDQEE